MNARMPHRKGSRALAAAFIAVSSASPASTDELIWNQTGSPVASAQPSSDFVAPWENHDVEVADDFDLVGVVTRVRAIGNGGPFLSPGAWVRFYDVGPLPAAGPGDLIVEYFFASSDPNLLWNDWIIEAVLPAPLEVKSRMFISVQQKLNSGSSNPTTAAHWSWSGTLNGFPNGEPSYIRNPGGGWAGICTAWCQTDADRIFLLFGELYEPPPPPPPPVIDSISPQAVARSGRFIITGSNFTGATMEHDVLINGSPTAHAAWTDTEIHAYVLGDAPLGPATVQLTTAGGASNIAAIDIQPTPPPAGGPGNRVKWRFLADHINISHRAAVGSDGTVYFSDSGGNVYALDADGGLKWIFNMVAGGISSGNEGPVAIGKVGEEETIYVAGDPLGPDVNIYALTPEGEARWIFTDTNTEGIIAGPSMGPDGNIYAVTDAGGLGAFALSPQGEPVWSNAGSPTLAEHGQTGAEVVFGSLRLGGPIERLYTAFDLHTLDDRLYSFSFDGTQQFSAITGTIDDPFQGQVQPAVGPDGSIYVADFGPGGGVGWRLKSFNPVGGAINWIYFTIGTNGLSNPDVGPDGTIYIVRNFAQLHAINPNGTERWVRTDSNINSTITVNPDGAMLLIRGSTDFGVPGFMQAASSDDGEVLWQVDLPAENGGNIVASSRAMFTADGATAYFGAAYLSPQPQDEYSYLYAIDTSPLDPNPADITGDGVVDVNDLLAVIGAWGPCPAPPAACPADIAPPPNGDGVVDVNDLLMVIGNWS